MSQPASPMPSATRPVDPALAALLRGLHPGQKIKVTQTVRVGHKQWTTTVTGTFRAVNYLSTGLATERDPDDAIVVVTVHFTKDNGELTCIAIDENSKVELLAG
jgi:hypothetical protein